MTIGWAQGVLLALMLMKLGINLAKHGEPQTGNYNVWVTLSGLILQATLLYFGGFFG